MDFPFMTVIVPYCVVALLALGSRPSASTGLERRVVALKRVVLMLVPGVVALLVVLIMRTKAIPRVDAGAVRDGTVPEEWYAAVRDLSMFHTGVLCLFAILFIGLAIRAILILRDLHSFVMIHRMDLAARDQVAVATDAK